MQITVDTKELREAIALVLPSIPKSPMHPVLANFYIAAHDGSVSIKGFDLTTGIETSVKCASSEPNVILVPRIFADVVSKLPDQIASISVDNNGLMQIKAGGTYKIQCSTKIEEYPDFSALEKPKQIELPVRIWKQLSEATLFCSSTDEAKQMLNGVFIIVNKGILEFAATDGHRLGVCNAPTDQKDSFSFTIPLKIMQTIARLISKSKINEDDDLILLFNESDFSIEIGDTTLRGRILAGDYPNYSQLIPAQFAKEWICDRQPLIDALERIKLFSDIKNGVVVFSVEGDSLTLTCDVPDTGNAKEMLSCESITDPELFVFAMNNKYFIEGFKQAKTEQVRILGNTPTSPFVVKPVSEDKEINALSLVMPVQIRT